MSLRRLWLGLYTPAVVLAAYPLALYTHAVVFVRRAWRTAWYAVPLLAGGVAFWLVTLSATYTVLHHGHWRFINPITLLGTATRAQQGQLQAGPAELLWLSVVAAAEKLQQVATAMAVRTGFSHWYVRADLSEHPTLISVGYLAMVVLGLDRTGPG
jgi:hypothetical protein